jgi:hypothetical protein
VEGLNNIYLIYGKKIAGELEILAKLPSKERNKINIQPSCESPVLFSEGHCHTQVKENPDFLTHHISHRGKVLQGTSCDFEFYSQILN